MAAIQIPPVSDQTPLGSGFGPESTATEVLDGIDLSGRNAVVTGGYSGIGLEVVRALTSAGAEVLIPARRPDEAVRALAGVSGVHVEAMDLVDQDQVREYAERVVASGRRVDLMINNAGIMACPEQHTERGWESQFATNHLGHFALVNHLWPALVDGARVVSVASSGHHYSPIRWEDPWFEAESGEGYDKWIAYGQSKTANILFALGLVRRAAGHPDGRGITAYSLHPGAILTNLGRHLDKADVAALVEPDEHGVVRIPEFKSPEAGAATAAWAATSPLLTGHDGAFLADCDIAPWAAEPAPEGAEGDGIGVRRYALDPAQADRLWTWSAELIGVDALEG